MMSEEILKIIENMDEKERWILINQLYDLHINKGDIPQGIEIDFDY
ncbi:hypothetical protein [Ectobacillus panaciterrae]|nr:hypothetical protein [Ectobacillus panaciterrae]